MKRLIITRVVSSSACEWCKSLAYSGSLDEAPEDIWRKHAYCACEIIVSAEGDPSFEKSLEDLKQDEATAGREVEVSEYLHNKTGIFATPKKFGTKVGKHGSEWGIAIATAQGREEMGKIIDGIIDGADMIFPGEWPGHPGGAIFYQKGEDVVIVKKTTGEFISILKGGKNNERVTRARARAAEKP